MSKMFFIGDGTEVLACEAYRVNAEAKLVELQAATEDSLNVYEADPTEIADGESATWQNPQEYAAAVEAGYDMPTLADVVARESDHATN